MKNRNDEKFDNKAVKAIKSSKYNGEVMEEEITKLISNHQHTFYKICVLFTNQLEESANDKLMVIANKVIEFIEDFSVSILNELRLDDEAFRAISDVITNKMSSLIYPFIFPLYQKQVFHFFFDLFLNFIDSKK